MEGIAEAMRRKRQSDEEGSIDEASQKAKDGGTRKWTINERNDCAVKGPRERCG